MGTGEEEGALGWGSPGLNTDVTLFPWQCAQEGRTGYEEACKVAGYLVLRRKDRTSSSPPCKMREVAQRKHWTCGYKADRGIFQAQGNENIVGTEVLE